MRILIVGLNFAPELTGVGKYTGEMAAWLAARGYSVTVITTRPYYPLWEKAPRRKRWAWQRDQWQGCDVIRCPLYVPRQITTTNRIAHLGSFALSSIPAAIAQVARGKIDLVCGVVPTLLSAPVALSTARVLGAKAWLHIQDLEIDAAKSVGLLGASPALKIGLRLERSLLKRFDLVSTISQKMLDAVAEKGLAQERLMLFPNWVNTDRVFPLTKSVGICRELGIPYTACIALYSGSMGSKQGLEYVIAAARVLASSVGPSPFFVLAGAGPARAELERDAKGLPNVLFLPLQPEERLNQFLNLADIHLLPQRRSAADLVMPSKLGAMLATGRPVIATVPDDSQVATTLQGAGVIVPPEDAEALAAAVLELSNDRNRRALLGTQGLVAVKKGMETATVMKQAEQRLLSLVNRTEPILSPA